MAIVIGSVKVASSRQRASFGSEGRPAKRSRMEPTMVCWSSESLTLGAVCTFLVSMLSVDEGGIPELLSGLWYYFEMFQAYRTTFLL